MRLPNESIEVMDKRQIKIFSIYSPEDVSVISEMAQTMEEEGISFERYFDNPSEADLDYDRLMENADLVLVLASDHSRRDALCCQCVKLAHDLNKNIVCVGYHKGGFFNRQSWVQDEWSLRTDIFAWLDMNSRAAFLAHMRGACGLETLEGDLVGARVTFSNYTDPAKCPYAYFRLYRKEGRNDWKKIVDRMQSSADITLRLRRGDYMYCLYSTSYPKRVSMEMPFSVKNDSDHQHFKNDLSAKMDQFLSYAHKCAETKRNYQQKIEKCSAELSRTIKEINERKWDILSRPKNIVWSSPMLLKVALCVAALFALVGVLSPFDELSSADGLFGLLSLLALPMIVFLHSSMTSIPFLISLVAITVFVSLILRGSVSLNKYLVFYIAAALLVKFLDMLFYEHLHLPFFRGLAVGGFVGLLITCGGYWVIQALKNMYWSKTSRFRIDYWNYRQAPYTENYNFLARKGSLLNTLGDMSPERLSQSNDDEVMRDEVVHPVDQMLDRLSANAGLAGFPVSSLVRTVVSLFFIFVLIVLGIVYALYLYGRVVG